MTWNDKKTFWTSIKISKHFKCASSFSILLSTVPKRLNEETQNCSFWALLNFNLRFSNGKRANNSSRGFRLVTAWFKEQNACIGSKVKGWDLDLCQTLAKQASSRIFFPFSSKASSSWGQLGQSGSKRRASYTASKQWFSCLWRFWTDADWQPNRDILDSREFMKRNRYSCSFRPGGHEASQCQLNIFSG